MRIGDVTYGNGQVIAASEFRDLTDIAERRTHDNGLVAVFLIVVIDALHRFHTRVLFRAEVPFVCRFVPVQDASHEGGNKKGPCFGPSDGLNEGKHESQVAIDAVL